LCLCGVCVFVCVCVLLAPHTEHSVLPSERPISTHCRCPKKKS